MNPFLKRKQNPVFGKARISIRMPVGKTLSYWDHLEILRIKIITILVFLLIASVFSFFFVDNILQILQKPVQGLPVSLNYFKPYEKILAYFKISFYSGLILTIPFGLFQIGSFIYPGLRKKERKLFILSFILIPFIFIAGILFSYFYIAPVAFRFFVNFGIGDSFNFLWSIMEYYDLFVGLLFTCGLIFQLPLIILILIKLKILKVEKLVSFRKYIILAIAIIAAILSPPDVLSMFLIGVPLYLLFELSVLIGKFIS